MGPLHFASHRLCTRTCRRCLTPWLRRRSSSPTWRTPLLSVGLAVWQSTTWGIMDTPGTGVCLGRGRTYGRGVQGKCSLLAFSSFGLWFFFLWLLLSKSSLSLFPHSRIGEKQQTCSSSLPPPLSHPLCRRLLCMALGGMTFLCLSPFLCQVLGAGQGGHLGCGHVH